MERDVLYFLLITGLIVLIMMLLFQNQVCYAMQLYPMQCDDILSYVAASYPTLQQHMLHYDILWNATTTYNIMRQCCNLQQFITVPYLCEIFQLKIGKNLVKITPSTFWNYFTQKQVEQASSKFGNDLLLIQFIQFYNDQIFMMLTTHINCWLSILTAVLFIKGPLHSHF